VSADTLQRRSGRWVGRAVERVEDVRLLLGRGSFLADERPPGVLEAVFVRSPIAHGLIRSIDAERARALRGVAVLTAGDLPHEALADLLPIEGLRKTPQPALATERVRFVGEPVALVLAANRYVAEDAAEAVLVDYEPLPCVLGTEVAVLDGAQLLFPDLGSNVVYRATRTSGDVDGAFARADHVVRTSYHGNRQTAVPMETRGCAASFDAARGELTFWSSTQGPHLLRRRLALATGIPEGRIRVLVPDVGGGFGQKIPIHPEELAVALAARALGHPVRWVEDRRENLVAAQQAKEQEIESELALASDGAFLGLRTRIVGNAGAYSYNNASALIEPYLSAVLMPGVYTLETLEYEVVAVVTNKPPVAPYRGIGWTAGHCARELLIETAAHELGLDPAELRRRNMVEAGAFPYTSCTGMIYDSGSFVESLDLALDRVDYSGLRERQEEARTAGRYLGIGISPYVEPTGWGTEGSAQASWVLVSHDSARVTLEPSGEIAVFVGTPSQGQGHATVFAQIVADRLGVAIDDVRVWADDTSSVPISLSGTRASRTAVVVGGAVTQAAEVLRERVLAAAAALLDQDAGELEIVDGGVGQRGRADRVLSLREVAEAVYFRPDFRDSLEEPEFSVTRFHDPKATYSNGCIVCVVEVDPGTGKIRVDRVVAVEDCGTVLNPLVVDGQIRGGVAQGIGAALLEQCDFHENGEPHRNTLFHYLLPTAVEVPTIEIAHCSSPSPYTPDGVKGMGESGMIATPGAVAVAVADALGPLGVRVEALPLTPAAVAEMLLPTRESE
jgi:carbon-monoxide dehydrogenase large subunit